MPTPVCHRCSSPLQRASFNQPGVHTFGSRMPEMYLGVVCQDCGRVECNRCKGSPADGPCSRCRGPVQPAWASLFQGGIDLSVFGPSTSAEPPVPWWKVLPGVVIGLVVFGFLAWGLWDIYRADPPYLTGPEKALALAVSADGRWAAIGAADRSVRLYDLEGGRETRGFLAHPGDVKWVAFHPDGRHVFSAGSQIDTLKRWDRETGQLVRQYGLRPEPDDRQNVPAPAVPAVPGGPAAGAAAAVPPRPLGGIAGAGLTADGARLLAADHRTLYTWDAATGDLLSSVPRQEPPRPGADRDVVFSPDGRSAVVWFRASSSTPGASPLELLHVASGKVARTLTGHESSVLSVGFTPDGRQIVSVDRDTLRVWDAAGGGLVSTWPKKNEDEAGQCLSVSPDGRLVALGGSTGSMFLVGIPLYDLTTGKASRTLRGHKKSVRAAAFLRDGRLLSSGGDGGIRLWDVASGTQQRPR